MDINRMKVRSILPPEYQQIYDSMFKDNREGNGFATYLSQLMESWMHRIVARSKIEGNTVLEIGAGNLNQLKYELSVNPIYDIVEPYDKLYKNSKFLPFICNIYDDISHVPNDIKYDRIISIATFEHILNLPDIMEKVCVLLKPGNSKHIIAIPNEGHFLWKLGWMCTTGPAFRLKYHLDYSIILEHEHVNTADEIEGLLAQYFIIKKCNVFGLSKKLSFYRVYTCIAK